MYLSKTKLQFQSLFVSFFSLVFKRNPIQHPIMPFYAVAKGRNPGIYLTWPECQAEVTGQNRPVFKKFATELEAEQFIEERGSGVIDKRVGVVPSSVPEVIDLSSIPASTSRFSHDETASENDGLNPELSEMKKEMKRLQKDLSKLRAKFEEYTERNGVVNSSEQSKSLTTSAAACKRKKSNSTDESSTTDSNITNGNSSKKKKSKLNAGRKIADDKSKFTVNSEGFLEVYTDGSCEYNGRSGARAGLGVYFGPSHPMNVSERVDGRQTNNTAEIQAAVHALELSKSAGFNKVQINTDSQFMIDCMTMWMPSWKRNDWKKKDGKEIKNLTDLRDLDATSEGMMVKWNHVKAHVGLVGNEAADKLARSGASAPRRDDDLD